MSGESRGQQEPLLTGIVVHWHDEDHLALLTSAWPDSPAFELLVVDNGSRRPLDLGRARRLSSGCNLGFAGGVNRGIEAARAPILLLLNPDARPLPGALDSLLEGFRRHPEAAALAPRLVSPDGSPQWRWQLRPLPGPWRLLAETLLLGGARGPDVEPAAGSLVEQPAAAALAVRRCVLVELGGLDEGFHPAWFEDVDLACRLRAAGLAALYWPAAGFVHALGASVPAVGYGPFLWIYSRHLARYLGKHHGAAWAAAARAGILAGALLRILLLPLRRPRRATSRTRAAAGLLVEALGALTAWRLPARLARQTARPAGGMLPGGSA